MTRMKKVKILFIGNSHTYYHDLPAWVALMAKEEGYECDVTMLAHGGWYLHQHVEEPDVRFNIKFGHYIHLMMFPAILRQRQRWLPGSVKQEVCL